MLCLEEKILKAILTFKLKNLKYIVLLHLLKRQNEITLFELKAYSLLFLKITILSHNLYRKVCLRRLNLVIL